MKILQLTEHYIPFLGGVENVIHEISRRLVRDGHDVEIICEREKDTTKYEIIDGVKIHRVFGFRLMKMRYDVGRVAPTMLLSAVINNADIVHSHAYGFFPTFASIFSNKPTVITTHSDPTAKIYPFYDLFRSVPIRLCNHVTALTEMEEKHLIMRGVKRENITVIPNGITLPRPIVHKMKLSESGPIILCLARLDIAHKGQDILLQAMTKVLLSIPDAKLWIVGKGDDLKSLKKLVEELNIDKSVDFKGSISESSKNFHLRNCDVFCTSPRTDSFPVVYLEAMAYGLPVVTTRVGGIPEVVSDSALLVPPNDPLALANALIQVLDDRALADDLRRKGLERVKQFNWDEIVKRYEKLYEELRC